MFCQKCGTQNPEDGKFCRKCGTDFNVVSTAIAGKANEQRTSRRKKRRNSWEGALTKLFMGFAFVVISMILGFSSAGRGWWFWMLIPGFAMIGSGIARIIQLRTGPENYISIDSSQSKQINAKRQESLPPKQTDFVSDLPDAVYETGDLVPPSVIENTTRHLEMDTEGETMTLPKNKL